ncbi:MAG: hypothetical protein Kow00120_23880 [Anaerolineae bacterium]
MNIKDKLMLMVVGLIGVVVVILLTRFSTDALGVIVGVMLAMAGTIPALVIVAWLAGKSTNPQPPRQGRYAPPPQAYYLPRRAPARRLYAPPPAQRRLAGANGRYALPPAAYRGGPAHHPRPAPPPRSVVYLPRDSWQEADEAFYDDDMRYGGAFYNDGFADDGAYGVYDDEADLW